MNIKEIEAIKSDIYMMQEASQRVWHIDDYKRIKKATKILVELIEKQQIVGALHNNYYDIHYCAMCGNSNEYGNYCSNCGVLLREV